jgi:sucrose phosphorylase
MINTPKRNKNQCQLIAYPDSLGTSIRQLHYVMNRYFPGCFGGVHILPFFPSSGDRGFAPMTYEEVDEKFGNWADVEKLGEDYDVMIDFMINHISRQSEYFKDFQVNGNSSEYADLFIRLNKLETSGQSLEEDLRKVYTRKPRPPYLDVEHPDGSFQKVWCTFDYEQIDLNLGTEIGRTFVRDIIIGLCRRNIKYLRVDAFGYTIKKLGTNCFFVEPETSNLLKEIADIASSFNVDILPEIHEHHSIQLKLASMGYRVYDFALPMLCFNALYSGKNKNLVNWLKICPRRQFTTLDTHDGLPVVDVVDLMSDEEIEETKNYLYERGANLNIRYSTDPAYGNLDIYQINCTYYSALGNNDQSYLLARAIQFFTPGIPQIYYVGLLAGENDIKLVESTKNGRDINRHFYPISEIESEVKRPVVQKLLKLIRFRNNYEVFDGEFIVESCPENELHLTWRDAKLEARLKANLETHEFTITYLDLGSSEVRVLEL